MLFHVASKRATERSCEYRGRVAGDTLDECVAMLLVLFPRLNAPDKITPMAKGVHKLTWAATRYEMRFTPVK